MEGVMASWALFDKEETDRLRRWDTVMLGGKIYRMCARCRKPVQVNKWLVGELHSCA